MRCVGTAGGFVDWPLRRVSSAPEYERPLSCFKVLVSVREPAGETLAAQCLEFLGPLFAAALRLTRNRSEAEDLVQDTFVKALRFADRFTPGTNLKAWLFTILHNTWRNRIRDAARAPVDVDSDRVEDVVVGGASAPDTPERILLRATLDADLQAALNALPVAFRQAVWLRDVEEFSYAEIGQMLEIPIGTVMSRISRGRRLLFDHLSAADRAGSAAAPGQRIRSL